MKNLITLFITMATLTLYSGLAHSVETDGLDVTISVMENDVDDTSHEIDLPGDPHHEDDGIDDDSRHVDNDDDGIDNDHDGIDNDDDGIDNDDDGNDDADDRNEEHDNSEDDRDEADEEPHAEDGTSHDDTPAV